MKHESCAGCALEKIGSGFTQIETGGRYEQRRILLVGEASGESEARDCLPFRPYAQSGSLLSDALREVGISRQDVAITNVVRCRPPKDWLEGAPYQFAATNHCITRHLIPAIEQLKPKVIVALGGTAQRALTQAGKGKAYQIEYAGGYPWMGAGAAEGIPVIPTYHPAFIRRGASHLTPLLHRALRTAWGIAKGEVPILEPLYAGLDYIPAPRLDEARDLALKINPDLPLMFDIETPRSSRVDEDERTSFTDKDIKTFQWTQRRGHGVSVPFREEFKEVVRDVLRKAKVKAGHNNWNFDDPVLESNGVDVGKTHDAMVMFHTYQPDLPANLSAAAMWCGFGFHWKDLAESHGDWYGVADVDATLCEWEFLVREMGR